MTNEGASKLRIGHWGLDIGHFLLGAYTYPFVQFELFVVLLPLFHHAHQRHPRAKIPHLTQFNCTNITNTATRLCIEITMKFQCDTTSRTPIYRQLIDQVRRAVARGGLRPGQRLPSVRQLSRELVVNPNTVARAYTELEREGTLVTQQGRGAFVAEPRTDLTKKARRGSHQKGSP